MESTSDAGPRCGRGTGREIKARGKEKKIWAGVWTRNRQASGKPGRVAGGTVTLEGGRTRAELIAWLLQLAAETPRMVVGIDCCFSYPACVS